MDSTSTCICNTPGQKHETETEQRKTKPNLSFKKSQLFGEGYELRSYFLIAFCCDYKRNTC